MVHINRFLAYFFFIFFSISGSYGWMSSGLMFDQEERFNEHFINDRIEQEQDDDEEDAMKDDQEIDSECFELQHIKFVKVYLQQLIEYKTSKFKLSNAFKRQSSSTEVLEKENARSFAISLQRMSLHPLRSSTSSSSLESSIVTCSIDIDSCDTVECLTMYRY
ncbi:hypothetical protein PPL_06387 [Heterostelium album PN500]|uniref:Uncharacterized protein n=1 Tax=Heterostelium pallidum (strain ATCC 26659 / Pp 5 / PN500) TaxID=670386 RepID=D3BD08_HETP5|nr:hypothetical protein PPL_06387 [Heterostelium album PN500]EFA80800.1 hypothetical protein PPL_06387 [Heterostelium album PN500]|eukprot:XP_020432919.1 hypothetical protein PPL_06387 [Heterostelium album PN500]